MDPSTKKRRWWQFGLKAILYVTLVVAAYCAGRSHERAETRQEVDSLKKSLKQTETELLVHQRLSSWQS